MNIIPAKPFSIPVVDHFTKLIPHMRQLGRAFALLLCVAACVPLCSYAQPGSHYGGAGLQFGYRIKPTLGGGFVAAGATDARDSAFEDYLVMRFDANGSLLWDRSYGRHGIYDFLWSIQPSSDNGSLIAGYSGAQFSGLEEALMYKLDSNGKVVKTLQVNYSRSDHAHWFAETADGHYYWAGHTDSKGDARGDMICQRLDHKFNLVWEKTYDHGAGEHCHAGTITRDGGCMLIGHTTVKGHEKFFAVRNDTSGAVEWQNVYSSNDTLDDSPYEVTNTLDGGFAFYGGTSDAAGNSQAWIIVVDSLGNKVWDHHCTTGQTFAWSGIQSSDSGFVIVGQGSDTSMNSQLYLAKLDKHGSLLWEHWYGPGNGEGGYGIYQRGSQFVVTGELILPGKTSSDLWILVVDSVGVPAPLAPLDNSSVRATASAGPIALGTCFPNPARESTMVDVTTDVAGQLTLELLDISGRVIRTMVDARVDVGRYFIRLDTRGLAAGTYECRLRSASGVLTQKLVVVH